MRNFRRSHLTVFRYRLTKNGSFGDFQQCKHRYYKSHIDKSNTECIKVNNSCFCC